MSEKITARVDSNRKLTISMSEGYAGEHNAQMLEIGIGPFAEGYDYYILNFDNYRFKGKITSNVIGTAEDRPAYVDNGVIYCPLTSQLTCTGRLRIQLEAHKKTDDGEIVRKSSVATVEFNASIMGEDDMMDSNSPLYGRVDEIEDKIRMLEERPVGITEIPVANEETLGLVKYMSNSEVMTDSEGNLRINYENINGYSLAILTVMAFFNNNTSVRTFSTENPEMASSHMMELSLSLLNGEYEKLLFALWTPCTITYFDENFDVKTMNANSKVLYCYQLNDGVATITPIYGEEMRKLVAEGV